MAENKDEKDFRPARFSCDTWILGKIHSNPWKYWFFNIEIFTYLVKIRINNDFRLWKKERKE